jgi:hypothetical protein
MSRPSTDVPTTRLSMSGAVVVGAGAGIVVAGIVVVAGLVVVAGIVVVARIVVVGAGPGIVVAWIVVVPARVAADVTASDAHAGPAAAMTAHTIRTGLRSMTRHRTNRAATVAAQPSM